VTLHVDLGDPRFTVGDEIARGGMSVVYAGRDATGRAVAIKACRTPDPAASMRLQREATMLARLAHPFILDLLGSGTAPGGAPWLVTRMVRGETLEQRLKREPEAWPRLLGHVIDVAEAMVHAHARGVVHRDLKPQNVLVDEGGTTIVVDWGLARAPEARATPAEPALSITLPGGAVGTPGYWAPEQRAGDGVDPRSDVYSIGAMVFRMVAGHPALPMVPTGDALDRELAAARPELRALVARATALDPDQRYQSMRALVRALRRCAGDRRRPWLLVGLAVAIVAACAVVLGAIFGS
jgi:serine/threonine-protein kinase